MTPAVVSKVLTYNEDGKILYAICAQKTNRKTGQVVPTILHVHAANAHEAAWIFGQDSDYKKYRIVAVAPAVGFFVTDNHGDKLVT